MKEGETQIKELKNQNNCETQLGEIVLIKMKL
jgi:hypothetical protein